MILRAKTMILTKDVRRHVALVNQQGALSPCFAFLSSSERGEWNDAPFISAAFGAGSWLPGTESLIIRLQQHLVIILKLADKFAETSEHDSAVSLRSHSVITLTGLLELYRLLVKYPLSAPVVVKEAQRRCGDILKMTANITERMLKEDWKQMADFFRVRLNFRIVTFAVFSLGKVNETWADERVS